MSGAINTLKFYYKSLVFGVVLALCALYGVLVSIVMRFVGRKEYAQYATAKLFYRLFCTLMGVKITLKNEKYLHETPAVVISNHQSALDVLILGKIFQPGYVITAKKALKYFPFLGWFMLASGTFFLDRSRGEKARKVLDIALASLKSDDGALFLFPEGTRSASKNLDLLPFKKGAFYLAKQARIPIIPCVVSNTSTIFHSKDKIFNRGEIIIEVLEPVHTEGLETKEDVDKFTESIRNKMLDKVKELGFSKTSDQLKQKSKLVEPNEKDAAKFTDIDTDTETETDADPTASVSEETPLVAESK